MLSQEKVKLIYQLIKVSFRCVSGLNENSESACTRAGHCHTYIGCCTVTPVTDPYIVAVVVNSHTHSHKENVANWYFSSIYHCPSLLFVLSSLMSGSILVGGVV